MIKKLYLENFKSILEPIELKFSNLTLIFGLNNVGKSSVIQSLDLISNISDKFELSLITDYKNYGSFESIINKDQPKKEAKIGFDFYQRNQNNFIEYSFTKNYSEFKIYDDLKKDAELIQSLYFDNYGFVNINEINKSQKSFMQLVSQIEKIVKDNKSYFGKLGNYINDLKKDKKYSYIFDKLSKSYEASENQEELNLIPQQINIILDNIELVGEELIPDFIKENKKKIEEYKNDLDLDSKFKKIFDSFFSTSLEVQNKCIELDLSTKGKFFFQKQLSLRFFHHIFINSILSENFNLNPRLKQRLQRFDRIKINNDEELKLIFKNLDNIIKFCKTASKENTKSKKDNLTDLIYKNIVDYKLNLSLLENFDFDLNLLKLIKDINSSIGVYENDSFQSSSSMRNNGYLNLPYQTRPELISIRRKIPNINILNNKISNERVYTYKNNNSYLDKIFELKDDKIFKNFLINSMNQLGFDIKDILVTSDENSFRIKIYRNNSPIDLVDSGTGLKNLFSIISQLYEHTNMRGTYDLITCIEEPEANLHPKFQAELGQLFVEIAKSQIHQRNQILIETHSQNLTLRILKLIRKGLLDPSDIAFNCLYRDSNDRISVFSPQILEDGNFVGSWPGGFFDEDLYELND
jgi:predicted ATPase